VFRSSTEEPDGVARKKKGVKLRKRKKPRDGVSQSSRASDCLKMWGPEETELNRENLPEAESPVARTSG